MALADAKEALLAARQALDADAEKTREAWSKVRPPMQTGGVYDPKAPTVIQTGGVNPDYRPTSRARVSLELAEEDAVEATRKAKREVAFLENQARDAVKHVKALKHHVGVYRAVKKPETPTLDLLRRALE